jgi:pyridoxine 5'-phosphate synthase PdxJ
LDAVDITYNLDLGINAAHFLSHLNVRRLVEINQIEAITIEHSMVSRAVLVGSDRAV